MLESIQMHKKIVGPDYEYPYNPKTGRCEEVKIDKFKDVLPEDVALIASVAELAAHVKHDHTLDPTVILAKKEAVILDIIAMQQRNLNTTTPLSQTELIRSIQNRFHIENDQVAKTYAEYAIELLSLKSALNKTSEEKLRILKLQQEMSSFIKSLPKGDYSENDIATFRRFFEV